MNPLMVKVYFRLRKGWKRLNKDAQQQVKQYLLSQRRANGYLNAGGQVDAYYTQFGKLLEAVILPIKVLWLPKKPLVVKESMGRDTIYAQFFAFLSGDSYILPQASDIRNLTLTAVCCVLAMQHQTGGTLDTSLISWLKERQDETGGFRSSEVAPVPDLLSTAVALFTLWLIGERLRERLRVGERSSGMGDGTSGKATGRRDSGNMGERLRVGERSSGISRSGIHLQSASRFIEAHWLDIGSFAPTLLDEYSDVEYLFYGLLALGSDV